MVSENNLSPFQERVLRGYKSRRKPRGRIHDKNAHVTIRVIVLDWLARKDIQEIFKLDELETHETIALVDLLVEHDQKIRNIKTRNTIEVNKKYRAELALEKRQLRLDL